MQRTTTMRAVLLAAAVTLSAGCQGILGIEDWTPKTTGVDGGKECRLNSECPSHQTCLFKTCGVACKADSDCSDGKRCLLTSDGSACVSSSQASCPAHACPAGTKCASGECRTDCGTGGLTCPGGQTCSGTVCLSATPDAGRGGASGSGGRSGSGGAELDASIEGGAGTPGSGGVGGTSGTDGGTGDGTAVGTLLQPCSPAGAYACAGHAQKGQLICANGKWAVNGTCAGSNNCDTTPGGNAGSCQPIIATCDRKSPGTAFCQGNDRLECGADLVTTNPLDKCPYLCTGGVCTGECAPLTRDCDGLTPRSCDATAHWVSGTVCPNLCSGGDCAGTCTPTQTRCNGLVVQTCDAQAAWQDTVTCVNQACPVGSGACTGVCTPGANQCSNNGVQTCGTNGQWGTPAPCTNQVCLLGSCVACTPGTKDCLDANTPRLCSSGGAWVNQTDCTAGSACVNGTCQSTVCVLDVSRLDQCTLQ